MGLTPLPPVREISQSFIVDYFVSLPLTDEKMGSINKLVNLVVAYIPKYFYSYRSNRTYF